MGRHLIQGQDSPYYPRRARWHGRLFHPGQAIRRRLTVDRLRLPGELSLGGLAAGFIVPGLAVWLRGPRLWGLAAMAGWAVLLAVCIVWLGYPVSNIAFGMMISLHVSGLVYYCKPLIGKESFRWRLVFSALALVAVGGLLYWPARDRWLMVLRTNGRVIIAYKGIVPSQLHRGDWVGYRLPELQRGDPHNGGGVWIQSGAGLSPILAVGGDQVVFSGARFFVNGRPQPALPHMPASGELIVPENHWFLWPRVGISGHGNVGEGVVSETMMELADVPTEQLVGKPLVHWLWREQNIR